MWLSKCVLSVTALCALQATAELLGPSYPAPTDLTGKPSLVKAGWTDLSKTLDAHMKDPKKTPVLAGLENLTFSASMFSLHDPAATTLQYHYTSSETAKGPNGTHKVDGDSIYRVASVSKLITTFAAMLEFTEEDWNRSLAEIVPALGEYAKKYPSTGDPIYRLGWDQITPWALVNQMSGVPHVGVPAGDAYFSLLEYAQLLGLPTIDPNEFGPCGVVADCPQENLTEYTKSKMPSLLPWTTPAYADNNFMLLGTVIAHLTGKPTDVVYKDSIFTPLNMTSTFYRHPTSEELIARSVVTGPLATSGFSLEGGATIPSGGILSTINDLNKFGTAILNSTLLSPLRTRKWLKPTSHTASLSHSFGAPWEINRYISPVTGKITDLYTKLGDSGTYGGAVVIIPDYDAGFTFLNAQLNTSARSAAAVTVLDLVVNQMLPALEYQVATEAKKNYVGKYVSTIPNLNSSLTIAFNESKITNHGLSISSWIVNSTDVLALGFPGGITPYLQPSISTPRKVAFLASTKPQTATYLEAVKAELAIGLFTANYNANGGWTEVGANPYGGKDLYELIFDVDGEGRATGLNTPAWRDIGLMKREEKK